MTGSRARWLAVVCLSMAGACSRQPVGTQVPIAGGDAGGLPRSLPSEEQIDASLLANAAADPTAAGARALVVLRHGHIVFERFGHGVDLDTVVAPDDFATVLPALAAGIAVHDDVFPLPARSEFDAARIRQSIEAGTHLSYAEYLSMHLWRRLNAGPAWIESIPGGVLPVDCCFHARVTDWLRLGDLLVEDGRFEGKQIVPEGWISRMRQPAVADGTRGFGVLLPPAAHGMEAFDARDVFFVRGPGHWRMWCVPSLRLVVLFGADDPAGHDAAAWDETRLLNLVTRSLSDLASPNVGTSRLKGLVPGH